MVQWKWNLFPRILPIQKFLLYYNMKKAYKKGIDVIISCKTESHIISTYNYIHNFRVLFGSKPGCQILTEKLMERCAIKRKIVRNK